MGSLWAHTSFPATPPVPLHQLLILELLALTGLFHAVLPGDCQLYLEDLPDVSTTFGLKKEGVT